MSAETVTHHPLHNLIQATKEVPLWFHDRFQKHWVPLRSALTAEADPTRRIIVFGGAALLLTTTTTGIGVATIKAFETITRPASFVEKTNESFEDSYQDIQIIYNLRKEWYDRDAIPTPALGRIFGQLEKYHTQLQELYASGQQNSPQANKLATEIDTYLNTAPGKDKPVQPTQIIVDPEAKNGEVLAWEIKELTDFLGSNLGRAVEKIVIQPPLPNFPFGAGMYGFKDQGAKILVFDRDFGSEEWTRKNLLKSAMHEIGHTISIYGEGYIFQFLTPLEIIQLVREDTQIWDKKYRLVGSPIMWNTSEEEENAFEVTDLLIGRNITNPNSSEKEIKQRRTDFVKRLFSDLLGKEIDLPEIGKKLDLY